MTTVREARVQAAYKALMEGAKGLEGWADRSDWLDPQDAKSMAEDVVNALFTPDPLIDNAVVPDAQ